MKVLKNVLSSSILIDQNTGDRSRQNSRNCKKVIDPFGISLINTTSAVPTAGSCETNAGSVETKAGFEKPELVSRMRIKYE